MDVTAFRDLVRLLLDEPQTARIGDTMIDTLRDSALAVLSAETEFHVLEATLNLTEGDPNVAVPTDFITGHFLRFGTGLPLPPQTIEQWQRRPRNFTGGTDATPTVWAWRGRHIWVNPAPDANAAIADATLYYSAMAPAFTDTYTELGEADHHTLAYLTAALVAAVVPDSEQMARRSASMFGIYKPLMETLRTRIWHGRWASDAENQIAESHRGRF